MAIDVFISPVYQRDKASVVKPAAVRPPMPMSAMLDRAAWRDLACAGEWEASLLEYLQAHRHETVSLWAALNEIAASTAPEKKWMLRETKKRLLEAMLDLIRAKKVARWRRSQIRLIDTHGNLHWQ